MKWIQLYNKIEREEYKIIIDLEIKNLITPLFATANFLHPKYKGRALLDYNKKYMRHIREFICDNITGEESLRVFTEYTENSEYFQKLIKITDNPILFWSNVANKQSMLQDFALNLLRIPPFTNQMLLSTSDCSINFDQEQLPNGFYIELKTSNLFNNFGIYYANQTSRGRGWQRGKSSYLWTNHTTNRERSRSLRMTGIIFELHYY